MFVVWVLNLGYESTCFLRYSDSCLHKLLWFIVIHVLNFLNLVPYKYNHIGIIKTKLKLNIFKQLKHKMKPENPRGKLNWVKINKKCKIQNYN